MSDLMRARPIDMIAWAAAYRAATDDAKHPPILRDGAQVGVCDWTGCRGPVIPMGAPDLRGTRCYFDAACIRCDRAYAFSQTTVRPEATAHFGYRPGA